MIRQHLLFPFALVLVLAGCDKLCSSTVTDQAKILNLTGRNLRVEICKGKVHGIQMIDISATQSGSVTFGTRQESYVQGGTDSLGNCARPDGAPVPISIALTTRDFNAGRFCYRDATDADVIIVDRADACPPGMREQAQPVDQCS